MSHHIEPRPTTSHPTELPSAPPQIGRPPGWLVRNGMWLCVATLGLFVALGWLVEYPDIVPVRVVLLGDDPPVRVVPRYDGRVEELRVRDGASVTKNQLLAVLENPANWSDVQRLKNALDTDTELPVIGNFGTLRAPLDEARRRQRDLEFFQTDNPLQRQLATLREQQTTAELSQLSAERGLRTVFEELDLLTEATARDSALVAEGLRAPEALTERRQRAAQLRREVESLRQQQERNGSRALEINAQILALTRRTDLTEADRQSERAAARGQLRAAVDAWLDRYVLRAPVSGRVRYGAQLTTEQQFARAGVELLTILPEIDATADVRGRAEVPLAGYGKVAPGMRVAVRLDAYPYREFGTLNGTVADLAEVPDGDRYRATVDFAEPLVTTHGDTLPYLPELSGTGRIITRDRRFIQRIYEQLTGVWAD